MDVPLFTFTTVAVVYVPLFTLRAAFSCCTFYVVRLRCCSFDLVGLLPTFTFCHFGLFGYVVSFVGSGYVCLLFVVLRLVRCYVAAVSGSYGC